MAMNPEVKAKWVAALKSGEYKQAKGMLRTSEGFCCLGVLCDLHRKETGEADWETMAEWSEYDGCEGTPPLSVVSWAGLSNMNPDLTIDGKKEAVAVHNDGRDEFCGSVPVPSRTFLEIAAAIEEQL